MKYTPTELGFPFKEVRRISVGECLSRDPEHTYRLGGSLFYNVLAHTHMCPNDPYRRSICVKKEFVNNKQIMWHEYAHVLTPIPYYVIECGVDGKSEERCAFGNKNQEEAKKEWNEGHSKEWAKVMKSFGLKPNIHYMGEP